MALTPTLRRGLMAMIVAVLVAVAAMSSAAAQEDAEEDEEKRTACSQAFSDVFGDGDLGWDTLTSTVECGTNLSPGNANLGAEVAGTAADTSDAVEEKIDGKFAEIIASIGSGALRGVMWLMTFWLEKPSSIVLNAGEVNDDGTAKNGNNLIFTVQDYTLWLQALFGVFSIFAIAVRFALSRWSDFEDNAADFLMTLGRIILTSVIWVPVIMLATRMSDGFAQWVISESTAQADEGMKVFLTNGEFPDGWNIATAWGTLGGTGTGAVILITSIISIITSVIQILFSFMREGMLVILCVAVPMVAYASALDAGKEAWGKIKGWTIALLLFAPAAALVYSIAFLAVGSIGEEDSIGVMGILVIFGMAVLVLPSLISLLAPQAGVAPAGGSGLKVAGAMVGGAATAAGMAVAGGAFGGGGSKAAAAAAPKGSAGPDTGGPGGTDGGSEGGGDPTGPTGGPGGTDGGSEGDGSSPMGSTGGDGGSEGGGGGTGGFGGDGSADSDGGDATSMGDPGTDGGVGGAEVEPPSSGEGSTPGAGSPESGPSSSPSPQGSPGAGAGESGSPSSSGPQGHSGGSPGSGTSTPSSPSGGQHRSGSPSTPPPAPPVTKLRDTPAQPPSGVPR
jgi:type IV secretion system protein TrbL